MTVVRPGRRRLRALSLIACTALVLAACGGEEEPAAGEDEEAEEEQSPPSEGGDETTDSEPESDDPLAAPELVDGQLPALEGGFPEEPITLWAGFSPGHRDDLLNILVAETANKYSPVRITTQNQDAGPESVWALVDFVESQPRHDEGYHVMLHSTFGPTLRLYTQEQLADTETDAVQVLAGIDTAPFAWAVPPDSEFDTLEDLEQYMQENPGELQSVGSAAGSGLHVALLAWEEQAGLPNSNYVPTGGVGEARQVLLGGGADFMLHGWQPGLEEQMKVLAITGDSRLDVIPDVPTLSELGYDIPAGSDRAYSTHPEVPGEAAEWLTDLMVLVGNDPEFAEQLEGHDVLLKTPDEVNSYMQNVIEVFRPVLADLGISERAAVEMQEQ